MLPDPSVRLRDAIISGNLLIVKRLLRRFPELISNMDPSNGWTSLHYASYYGRYLICVYLIQLSRDKHEFTKTFRGNTCVHLALMNGHEQTTHLLLQHDRSFINCRGEYGRTPAHVACIHDYHQCLSLLMSAGANLTIPDDDGETPLHLCLEYGSVQCMRMLLRDAKLIDDDLKDSYKWRPSEVANTFELSRLYNKMRRDLLLSRDSSKRSQLPQFQTPHPDSRPTFETGPSPVLSLNSPYVAYNYASTLPSLPSVSTTKRPSNTSIITQSFVPRNSGARASSLVLTSTASSAETIRSSSSSSKSPSQAVSNGSEGTQSPAVEGSATISSNSRRMTISSSDSTATSDKRPPTPTYIISPDTMMNNKNILDSLNEDSHQHQSVLNVATRRDSGERDGKTREALLNRHSFSGVYGSIGTGTLESRVGSHSATMSGSLARKKLSLLNIPISKLRNTGIDISDSASSKSDQL